MERILKSSDFEMAGKIQLPGFAAGAQPVKTVTASASAQASVVESNEQFAVIEVTCPCGRKTLVKCEYAQQ